MQMVIRTVNYSLLSVSNLFHWCPGGRKFYFSKASLHSFSSSGFTPSVINDGRPSSVRWVKVRV